MTSQQDGAVQMTQAWNAPSHFWQQLKHQKLETADSYARPMAAAQPT